MNKLSQPGLWPAPMDSITKSLILEVKGSIPSFKNNKMLLTKMPSGRPLDRPLLITKPEYQKRIAEIEDSFVSQLLCAFQTDDGQTLTGSSLRCAIALSVPEDDCWTQVPEIHFRGEPCARGQEGATVLIERL